MAYYLKMVLTEWTDKGRRWRQRYSHQEDIQQPGDVLVVWSCRSAKVRDREVGEVANESHRATVVEISKAEFQQICQELDRRRDAAIQRTKEREAQGIQLPWQTEPWEG